MPVGGGKKDLSKKKARKSKGNTKRISTINTNKNVSNGKQDGLSNLTPANISSLRWEFTLKDPILENNRIEKYKELRRQRYNDAQQQVIQNLVEKMKITDTNQ